MSWNEQILYAICLCHVSCPGRGVWPNVEPREGPHLLFVVESLGSESESCYIFQFTQVDLNSIVKLEYPPKNLICIFSGTVTHTTHLNTISRSSYSNIKYPIRIIQNDMSHSSPRVQYQLIGAHTRYSSKIQLMRAQSLASAHPTRLDCSYRDPPRVLLYPLYTNYFKCSSQQRIRSPLLANRFRTSPNRHHRRCFRRTPNNN